MRMSTSSISLLSAGTLPAVFSSQTSMTMVHSGESASGKSGGVLVIQEKDLGQDDIAALYYLTGRLQPSNARAARRERMSRKVAVAILGNPPNPRTLLRGSNVWITKWKRISIT